MNKQVFLQELGYLLQDISDEDREDALGYYKDYFEDAGKKNETKILNELQSPERVAALIKAGLNDNFKETIEYSESSMGDSRYNYQHEVVIPKNDVLQDEIMKNNWKGQSASKKGSTNQNNRLAAMNGAFLLVGSLFLLFLGLPILGTVFLLFFSFILLLFSFGTAASCFSFVSASLAIMIFLKSIWELQSYPAASFVGIGVSLLLFALAVTLFKIIKWSFKLLPVLVKGSINLFRNLIDKVGAMR
jgi:uncharacterized membrane protein